ncbi:hypothetical protein F4801DRAFT_556709 [Xylaria longipes]|nr:hypothetical protein F4801DRAFT_556709 [Xylaria longipes]
MSSTGGPYFTSDGRPYYMVNGQAVWATSGQGNPSMSSGRGGSNRTIAHSVESRYESHRYPEMTSSYPPASNPSGMRTRMTSGFPSRFNAGQSQGSAPGDSTSNYYRDGMEREKNRHGPALGSHFSRSYNEYKDRDAAADSAQDGYKAYLGTASKTSKRTRSNSPGVYDGQPPETRDWHRTAAHYADVARTEARGAADARGYVASSYIGYDKPEDIDGHRRRERLLRATEKTMNRKYNSHSNTHH